MTGISVSGGSVRFTINWGGGPRTFAGALKADTIEGTIEGNPPGRFSLKLVG